MKRINYSYLRLLALFCLLTAPLLGKANTADLNDDTSLFTCGSASFDLQQSSLSEIHDAYFHPFASDTDKKPKRQRHFEKLSIMTSVNKAWSVHDDLKARLDRIKLIPYDMVDRIRSYSGLYKAVDRNTGEVNGISGQVSFVHNQSVGILLLDNKERAIICRKKDEDSKSKESYARHFKQLIHDLRDFEKEVNVSLFEGLDTSTEGQALCINCSFDTEITKDEPLDISAFQKARDYVQSLDAEQIQELQSNIATGAIAVGALRLALKKLVKLGLGAGLSAATFSVSVHAENDEAKTFRNQPFLFFTSVYAERDLIKIAEDNSLSGLLNETSKAILEGNTEKRPN
tara:strand:- start:3139 stop:4170 length:1032 start_codon:yes stop_codon:yes gene_type:complete